MCALKSRLRSVVGGAVDEPAAGGAAAITDGKAEFEVGRPFNSSNLFITIISPCTLDLESDY